MMDGRAPHEPSLHFTNCKPTTLAAVRASHPALARDIKGMAEEESNEAER